MDWTMVGALGEMAGAVAVVASLLYVGHQVRQNNRIARAEAYRDVTLSWAKMLHLWASDAPAAKAFMDSASGVRLADLPEDARNAYLLRHAALIRVLETIYRQVQEGVMEADALGMLPGAATPLFRDSWKFLRGSYNADFRAYFEDRYELAEPEAGTRA
jgi:hypothetical protein